MYRELYPPPVAAFPEPKLEFVMLREAPKLLSVSSALGEAKLAWLRMLKMSASNRIRRRSLAAKSR